MATMLPIFGATLPNTPAGLRPICVQACPTECDLIRVAAGSFEASHEAVTPAPAISKNRRREICGRLNPPAEGWHLQISRLNFSCCWVMASSGLIVEHEIQLVKQAPQQVF